jgi:hypothetical protein
MRYSLILLVAAMVLSLGIRYFADPVRLAQTSHDPAHDLLEMVQRDPLLGTGLDQADRGDIAPLSQWINRAETLERQQLALLLLRVDERPDQPAAERAEYWKHRYRFRAFLALSTGSEGLDAQLDNLVAYTLAIGEQSSEDDRELARSLLPRLKRVARETSDPSIMDTIGCVEFSLTDFAAAKESFDTAKKWHKESHEKPSGPDYGPLYARRFEVADHNARLKSEHAEGTPDPSYEPLPKEEEVVPVVASQATKT